MSWDRSAQLAVVATLDDSSATVLHEWFPCSELLAGDGLAVAAERFRIQSPGECEAADEQATRWAACLTAAIAGDPTAAGYASDVATYEGIVADLALSAASVDDACLAAARNALWSHLDEASLRRFVPVSGRHVRLAHFHYDAVSIAAAIEACDRLGEQQQPAPCTALFVRRPYQPRPDVMYVSNSVELLLGLCDGRRDGTAIVEGLRGVTGGDHDDGLDGGFAGRAFDALDALRKRNVLSDAGSQR